jgi:hypothetical protein
LHPQHSDLPITCTAVGVSYEDLIREIVESAYLRAAEGSVASVLGARP